MKTTAVAVSGTNLVLTIPQGTYVNNKCFWLNVAQAIPTTITQYMPVVVQIGTGETLYPVRTRCGHNVYANQLKTGRFYLMITAADSGTFILHGWLNTCNIGNVNSLP